MKNLIDVSMKRGEADTVLKNCTIVNVFSGTLETGDIAIVDGCIAGIGEYDAEHSIDMTGKVVCPGFIDTHMHIESSMLPPSHFAGAVIPYGTTTCIADPHEIANVAGVDGIQFMINDAKGAPVDFKFMLPSCVPATPFEHNGATIDGDLTSRILDEDRFLGLGEFMNAPGVIFADEDVLKKLESAKRVGKVVDGHYPNAGIREINAYAGTGIKTDHECVVAEDAMNKLKRGMYIQIREGSATRNLDDLIGIVNDRTLRRVLFCTDDKQVEDLLNRGHINNSIKMAIAHGISPIDAITIATLNASECYNLSDRGAIAPGRIADIVVLDSLESFNILEVYKRGKLVAKDGKGLYEAHTVYDPVVRDTVHMKDIALDDLTLHLDSNKVRVMRLLPKNVVTEQSIREVSRDDEGNFVYDANSDISKIVVVERHKATGNIGIGLIEGYGVKGGALALSVAHDSHNIIAIGDNDRDILVAINEIKRVGGGMTAVHNGEVYGTLELPIAGLMSDKDVGYILTNTRMLTSYAVDELHVSRDVEPFMSLSFLSLVVIPRLKINDSGLFDYDTFSFVPIEAE